MNATPLTHAWLIDNGWAYVSDTNSKKYPVTHFYYTKRTNSELYPSFVLCGNQNGFHFHTLVYLKTVEDLQKLWEAIVGSRMDCCQPVANRRFIGVKDKNGKKIYEGDIVETKNKYFISTESDKPFEIGTKVFCFGDSNRKNLKPERILVEYKNELCGFYPFSRPAQGGYDCEFQEAENCIVIGNVFENPELVEHL